MTKISGEFVLDDGSTIDELASDMLDWLLIKGLVEDLEFTEHLSVLTCRQVGYGQQQLVKRYLKESGLVLYTAYVRGGSWRPAK